jgi:hypothetical protein
MTSNPARTPEETASFVKRLRELAGPIMDDGTVQFYYHDLRKAADLIEALSLTPTGDPSDTEALVERVAAHIYQEKADRKGVSVIGWESEPEKNREDWRADVRETLRAAGLLSTGDPSGAEEMRTAEDWMSDAIRELGRRTRAEARVKVLEVVLQGLAPTVDFDYPDDEPAIVVFGYGSGAERWVPGLNWGVFRKAKAVLSGDPIPRPSTGGPDGKSAERRASRIAHLRMELGTGFNDSAMRELTVEEHEQRTAELRALEAETEQSLLKENAQLHTWLDNAKTVIGDIYLALKGQDTEELDVVALARLRSDELAALRAIPLPADGKSRPSEDIAAETVAKLTGRSLDPASLREAIAAAIREDRASRATTEVRVGEWQPTHRHYNGGLYREIGRADEPGSWREGEAVSVYFVDGRYFFSDQPGSWPRDKFVATALITDLLHDEPFVFYQHSSGNHYVRPARLFDEPTRFVRLPDPPSIPTPPARGGRDG